MRRDGSWRQPRKLVGAWMRSRQSRNRIAERSDKIGFPARRWFAPCQSDAGKSFLTKTARAGPGAPDGRPRAPMGRRAKTARPWPSTQSAPCASEKVRRRHSTIPLCWLLASLSARASCSTAAFQVPGRPSMSGARTRSGRIGRAGPRWRGNWSYPDRAVFGVAFDVNRAALARFDQHWVRHLTLLESAGVVVGHARERFSSCFLV